MIENYLAYKIDTTHLKTTNLKGLDYELCVNNMIFLNSSLLINSPYCIDMVSNIKLSYNDYIISKALSEFNGFKYYILKFCFTHNYFMTIIKFLILFLKTIRNWMI